jgi:hypothetical protein
MVPPEIILDRWVRTRLCNQPGFSGYKGKLDIERVESPSFRSFLHLIQEIMNGALRLEGVNASGGAEHPPFHFDYLDVDAGVTNALAFQEEGISFIVVTLPMVELIWQLSRHLSRTPLVLQLLSLDPGSMEPDVLQGLLFEIQLSFLVSHEYTHHIHGHSSNGSDVVGVWTEFCHPACGSINSQALEIDADGYAVYLVLSYLLRGERRNSALAQLGGAPSRGDGDELLLTCFFLAVLAFFCTFWRGNIDMASVYRFRHPPPPVRIKYVIQVAEMWCGQNGFVARQSWFSPARFQELFRVAAEVAEGEARQSWDSQMTFLRSVDGAQYDQQLLDMFEAVRQKGPFSKKVDVMPPRL